MSVYLHRMGDGQTVELTGDELRKEMVAGSEDAAERAGVRPLNDEEYDHLYDILTRPGRVVGVERGNEVVLTDDGCVNALYGPQSSSGVGVPVSRELGVRVYERAFCFDTMELGQVDYSFKPVKPIVPMEQQTMESLLHATIIPLFYGAMPNMALYARPDGPFPNPADLLPQGKIAEAQEAQLEAAQALTRDLVYVSKRLHDVGADGIDFDTTASAGDVELLATLEAVEELAATTDLAIQVGMAAEFVLGMHGRVEYKGRRLAGLYPHDQVKVVEEAGAHVFGPVVNTNTRHTGAWNIARAVTFVRACTEVAEIPVHPNVGMGVGGVLMT